ncbi:FAD/NAD(P)-binding domain-containing protein [Auricularia subglabra TFB-10046 SS5]|nr:FAD/NAD(P)-binding domain-containing protein [Auricularia subglabra TFB-10046 SS5]
MVTRDTSPPNVASPRRAEGVSPSSRKATGKTPIRVTKTARAQAVDSPSTSQQTLDMHFGPRRRKQAYGGARTVTPAEVIEISSDGGDDSPPRILRASRSRSPDSPSPSSSSEINPRGFQKARKAVPRSEHDASSPYQPEADDSGSSVDSNASALSHHDSSEIEEVEPPSQGTSSQTRKPFATPLRAELAVTPAVPPPGTVRQLRPRRTPPKQQDLNLTEEESGSDREEQPLSEFDNAVFAMWEMRRLPFLPRLLRRALEPYFADTLGHSVRLGVPRDQVDERWVCPVCPVFGFFSSPDARDLHVRYWHEEYNGKFITNNALRAGPTTAPLRARIYMPDPPVKSPPQGLHFPHISERATGLQPMPNFGYMRDRVRFEEMRVLARPGPRQIFAAAWKRWIFEHRQDFIAAPARAMGSFLHEYAEPVRLAGKDVLKAWLLALVNQSFLTEFEFVDVYGEWAKSERQRAARLSPAAQTTNATPPMDAATFAQQKFDFIVVGGGTAGTAIGVRLSEVASWKVGIIEAGVYHKDDPAVLARTTYSRAVFFSPDEKVQIPQGWNVGKTWGNASYDWNFKTTPQARLNNREIPVARGKGLEIGELGNPGWSFKEFFPYFIKTENVSASSEELQQLTHATIDPRPIHTSFSQWYSEAIPPVVDTLIQTGLKPVRDPGGGTDASYVWNPILAINQETQERSYAANAYYEPNAHRTNLIILTRAQVLTVNLSPEKTGGNHRATGVTYLDLTTRKSYAASATTEVIVSAGGVQSPQILELSGIGNRTLLNQFGIEAQIDLPAVGENYQDHLMVFETFEVPNTFETWDVLNDPVRNATEYAEYLHNRTGMYTAGINAISYMTASHFLDKKTLKAWVRELDREFNASSTSPGARAQYEIQRRRLSPDSKEATLEIYAAPASAYPALVKPNTSYIQIVAIPTHPFTRGSIHIKSGDPLVGPAIDLNAWARDIDRKIMLSGGKYARSLTRMKPLSPIILNDVAPPKGTASDEEWLDFIRDTSNNPYHPCCTAAMLPQSLGGVVDPKFKVYGTSNLRVVDLSILPMMLGTHLMGTAYAIGERGADFVKAAHGRI